MQTAYHEPEDWRRAVNRLREESATVLRELFSGHVHLERDAHERASEQRRGPGGLNLADDPAT